MATVATGRPGADPAASAPAAPDVALLPVDNPWLLAVGIMTATLLQILDTTIANVAIPHMQAALGTTPDEISWVLTSYIVASAVALPMTGWLADRVGSRPLFLWSVVGFIITSMLCGVAQNLEQMVLFRGLQGIAGAFISPLSQAAMIDTNPPSKHAKVIAVWGMGVMVGPILGPIVGGWLTENWNWRAVFYVNLPMGLVALTILYFGLPNRPAKRRPFDTFGFSCVAIMLASIQLLLDRGNQIDWFASVETWIYCGLAISALWMAVLHFRVASNPLFHRSIFTNASFLTATFLMFVMGIVMFAAMVLLPPMLQHLFGYDVLTTGFVLMPRGVGVLASMQVTALLMRKGVRSNWLVAAGFAVVCLSCFQMAGWSLAVDQRQIVTTGFIQGLGMGLAFIPLNTMAFANLPPMLRTEGSSVFNLSRSMGSSIGISLVTTLLARNVQVNHEVLGAHVTGQALSAFDLSTIDRYQGLGAAMLYAVDAEVNRQAAMIAYVDDFLAMAILSLVAIPLVILSGRRAIATERKAQAG
jgi:DHA2 family multidrug resistance protein